MAKQTKPFILEIKTSRRTKTKPAEQAKSIWGELASDLRQNLTKEQEVPEGSPVPESCPDQSDPVPAVATDSGQEAALPPGSQFLEKWIAKKAKRPKTGSQDVIATFLARIEQQKQLLAEYESDTAGFARWRSAWFRKVDGGFGVSISHDSVDAGGGLRYVVVDTVHDVSAFLDDLGHHAQTDTGFQRALSENRTQRAGRRSGTRAM